MKKLAVVVVVLAVIGVGAFAAFKLVRGGGLGGFAAGLDNWVAQQVVGIGNAYLVPQIKFDSFKYQYPGTLDLTGVTLTAPDGTQVVKAAARITLAEIPKMNQPIVIERIELRDAALRLIATPEGGFKGLVPFVKGQAIAQQETVEEDVRLSRVLRIGKLSLENGSIEYDDGTGAPPMVLGGLALAMDIDEKPDQDGWYAIKTSSKVGGLADLDVKGRINLDSFAANFETLNLTTELAENTYGILPPSLQQLAREHEMRGSVNASATGDVMLRSNWRSSRLEARLDLRDFNIAWDEYRVPIETGSFPITISEKRITMPQGALQLLGGTAALNGLSVNLATESMPTQAQWEVRDLDLQKMLRVATPKGQPPKLAGTLMSAGEFSLEAGRVPGSVAGRGELHLANGRIAEMPVLQQILEVANLWGKLGEYAHLDHSVDSTFDLTGEGARVTSLEVQTPVIGLRGDGMIFYDTRLDLMLNGGPVEKIRGLLGDVGKVIGKVTDKFVGYRVRGTLAKPEVSVAPLGL